jgi:hypothetical protein
MAEREQASAREATGKRRDKKEKPVFRFLFSVHQHLAEAQDHEDAQRATIWLALKSTLVRSLENSKCGLLFWYRSWCLEYAATLLPVFHSARS